MLTNKEIKDLSRKEFEEEKWTNVGVFAAYESIISATSSAYGVGLIFVGGAMTAGYSKYFLNKVRKSSDTKFINLFDGFKDFWKNMGYYMLNVLYTFLWCLLFIIPGIIKSFAYSMEFYILQDHPELSAKEALEASEKLMYGHKWSLFCLSLRFLGWNILGAFTWGILTFLFVGPWQSIAVAHFYQNLVDEQNKNEKKDTIDLDSNEIVDEDK